MRFATVAAIVTLLLAAGGLAGTALVAGPAAAGEELEWDYAGLGPDRWAELFPEFCAGQAQSPIDIDTGAAAGVQGPSLRLVYDRTARLEVVNTGETVRADLPAGAGHLLVDGERYDLLQFHFHTPSEHELDGRRFALELHLVHRKADGALAVVGAVVERGARHAVLDRVFRNLPEIGDTEPVVVRGFRLRRLVPAMPEAFHYLGSLTTPPCTEGVSWFVRSKVIQMSWRQIAGFRRIFSGEEFPDGNSRPVQPQGGRTVVTVNPR
jgi:carbonic anhydrase